VRDNSHITDRAGLLASANTSSGLQNSPLYRTPENGYMCYSRVDRDWNSDPKYNVQ
jgi:hypothetical protein